MMRGQPPPIIFFLEPPLANTCIGASYKTAGNLEFHQEDAVGQNLQE